MSDLSCQHMKDFETLGHQAIGESRRFERFELLLTGCLARWNRHLAH